MTPDPKIRANAGDGYPWFLDASKDPNNWGASLADVRGNKCYYFTICGGRRNSWTDVTCSSNKVNKDDELPWSPSLIGRTDTNNICELPYVVENTNNLFREPDKGGKMIPPSYTFLFA